MANSTIIREEYFGNDPTGVEAEEGETAPAVVEPWDPERIRVGTKQFSLRNILDLIDEGGLELAPDFQRNKVWKPWQKSRLIESVLLQIPLPAFYFAEDANGVMHVVDGLQRLSTVHDYVRKNAFALTELEYLGGFADRKRFQELPPAMQRRIHNSQILAHVVDPTTPPRVKYDIFRRINTGGTPLTAQEIRHCMSRDRSRNFLKLCTHTPEFDRATGGRFRDHIRMDDRDVVLRFCAFWLQGVEGYVRTKSMDVFLEVTTEMLDNPDKTPDSNLEALYHSFRSSMAKCYELFGEHSFRKWPHGQDGRNPINRPLFESWAYVLDKCDQDDLRRRRDAVVKAARDLMTHNSEYIDAISISTGDPRKVRARFALAEQATRAGT